MRLALAQAPNDPEIMTITAMAHERAGSRELAGEQLARAVEVSGQAPAESLRYARFLLQDERIGPAEGVVVDALRRAPGRPAAAARARPDPPRAPGLGARRAGGRRSCASRTSPEAKAMAASLETASLRGQGRAADAAAALEGLAGPDGAERQRPGDGRPGAELCRGRRPRRGAALPRRGARQGSGERRRRGCCCAGLDQRGRRSRRRRGRLPRRWSPTPLPCRRRIWRSTASSPARAAPPRPRRRSTPGSPRRPTARRCVFAKAGLLEQKGDIDGAIAAYEALYAKDSGSPVLANNLASLLASYRDDPASLERAFAIARRLRGTDVPYFQDTYGWILHRRGDERPRR